MTDNTDVVDNLSIIDNFILATNPNVLNKIRGIRSLLSQIELDKVLESIVISDDVTDSEKLTALVTQCKMHTLLFIKQYGIIVNHSEDSNIPLDWYLQMLNILNKLNYLTGVEYLHLGDILGDTSNLTDNDRVNITYDIFNILDSTISEEMFDDNVLKVYPEFIDVINKHVTNSLNDINNDDVEDDPYVTLLVNIFLNLGTDIIPQIVSDIIEDPSLLPMVMFNNDKLITTIVRKIGTETDDKELSSLVMDYYIVRLLSNGDITEILDDILSININDDLYTYNEYEKEVYVIHNFIKDNNINILLKKNVYDTYVGG